MQHYEFELAVGEAVRVGEATVTILDIDGAETSVRVDRNDDFEDLVVTELQAAVRSAK